MKKRLIKIIISVILCMIVVISNLTISNMNKAYADDEITLEYGGTTTYTIPENGKYLIKLKGASNGTSPYPGYTNGYLSQGHAILRAGDVISVKLGTQNSGENSWSYLYINNVQVMSAPAGCSAGAIGMIDEDMFTDTSTGADPTWKNTNGCAIIKYEGSSCTKLIVNVGSYATVDGKHYYEVLGNLGEKITIPEPLLDAKYSFLTFKGYELAFGDGTYNDGEYTFGRKDAYLDARYEGLKVIEEHTQVDDTVHFKTNIDGSSIKTLNIEGSYDLTNWEILAQYKSPSELATLGKGLSLTGNRSGNYTVPIDGYYTVKLTGGGAGQDGGSNGGSGASMSFTMLLKEGQQVTLYSASAGTDSDNYQGSKAGGGGIFTGGYGAWSGGGGGAAGIKVDGYIYAIAAGGGGGNWAQGLGGNIAQGPSNGQPTNGNGQNGTTNGGSDTGGGGAGWSGGSQGIDGVRGGNGGTSGYSTALVPLLQGGISQTAGRTGGGRNNGSASITFLAASSSLLSNMKEFDVKIKDRMAPDIPNRCGYTTDNENFFITLSESSDIGNYYYIRVPEYIDAIPFFYKSGFNGWRYIVDTNENTVVNSNNSTFIEKSNNSLTLNSSNNNKYMHIAAVDKSGNISETYTFQLRYKYVILYAKWSPIEYKIYYEKGLTDDKIHTDIELATRNDNIQLSGDLLPYTSATYDSQVRLADIGELLGRNYTVKFDSNRPASVNKQREFSSSMPTVVDDTKANLESKKIWKITGYETPLTVTDTPKMGELLLKPNYLSIDESSVIATAQWRDKELKNFKEPKLDGWYFIGWYDNQRGSDSIAVDELEGTVKAYKNTINTSNTSKITTATTSNNVTELLVRPSTTEFKQTLYARWQREVELKFILNLKSDIYSGSGYKGKKDDITLKGVYYNNADGYTFRIDNTLTAANKPDYEQQINKIDAYGTCSENGENLLYTMTSTDGVRYRFLGWSTNPDATEPDEGFSVFNDSHAKAVKIYDNTVLYGVWEPILDANIELSRTLGNANADGGAAIGLKASSIGIPILKLKAKSGEQCKYVITSLGRDDRTFGVIFDSNMTNIYDIPGSWTDSLNPSTSEDLYDGQTHGMNRAFELSSKVEIRKFYIPQYLGTSHSYPGNEGVNTYGVVFSISQPSYYYRLTYGTDESILIDGKIIINSNSDDPGDPDDTDDVDTILNDLRTKLRVRIKN